MSVDNNKYYDSQDDDRTDEQLAQDEEIMRALSERHYFVAQDDNDRFCKICDKYMTDHSHYKTPSPVAHQAC